MVTCNYHGINFHVYFLVFKPNIFLIKIKKYLFSCQLVKVKISSSIKGPALCYPFITSLIYICIIVVITNCV